MRSDDSFTRLDRATSDKNVGYGEGDRVVDGNGLENRRETHREFESRPSARTKNDPCGRFCSDVVPRCGLAGFCEEQNRPRSSA